MPAIHTYVKVIQVVDANHVIVDFCYDRSSLSATGPTVTVSETLMLECPTGEMHDGEIWGPTRWAKEPGKIDWATVHGKACIFHVKGNTSYTNVMGAKKTILAVEVLDLDSLKEKTVEN